MAEPGTAEAFFTEGTRLLQDGYLPEALEQLQYAATLDNGAHFAVTYNVAIAYFANGQADAALEQAKWFIDNHTRGTPGRERMLEMYYWIREGTAEPLSSIQEDLAGI